MRPACGYSTAGGAPSRRARITTPGATASGCGASLTAQRLPCGGDRRWSLKPHLEGALFESPKPQLGEFHQSNGSRPNGPSWRSGNTHGFCVTGGVPPIASEPTPSPRLWAASPGATPARLCEHYHVGPQLPANSELSTWLASGTFYLAGKQNFLLGSDKTRLPFERQRGYGV